jgi:hypothetical protein
MGLSINASNFPDISSPNSLTFPDISSPISSKPSVTVSKLTSGAP